MAPKHTTVSYFLDAPAGASCDRQAYDGIAKNKQETRVNKKEGGYFCNTG